MMNEFKKALFAISLFLLPSALSASSPSKISISNEGKMLYILVAHETSDPSEHFIKEIEIFHNGKFVFAFEPFAQENEKQQSFTYGITNLKPGDKIQVKTKCNKSGSKTATYTAQ